MLNRNSERGCSCLAIDLRGKAFSHPPLSMMLALGFLYVTFRMLRKFSFVPSVFSAFNHKRMLSFVNALTLADIQNPGRLVRATRWDSSA